MATPARFVNLTLEQDESLRELEMSPGISGKVRLRASIIRLNGAGWSAPKLAAHFGRNLQSIHNDLNRFEQSGVVGLVDGKAPGNKPSVTAEIRAFLERKLAEEQVWNSTLLGEAVREQFGIRLGREVVRVTLLKLSYRWKRTRYAPGKQADPEMVAEHRASLETLKRGRWTRS